MNTRLRVLAATASVIAMVASAVVFAAPAQAAYSPAPMPNDGQAYVYGVPVAQLAHAIPTARSTIGGWLNQDWHKTSIGYSQNGVGTPFRPLWFELWEPYVDASGNVQIPIYVNAPQDNQNGGNLYGSGWGATAGALGSTTPQVACQKTEWAVAGASTNVYLPLAAGISGQQGGPNGSPVVSSYHAMAVTAANVASVCPYIREIDTHVEWWNNGGGAGTSPVIETIESWYARNAYVDHTVYQPWAGLNDICALSASTVSNPISPGCTDIYGAAGRVDGEDFTKVCANPPASWVWGDFSWLAGFVGFYAKCLFAPINGWDRDHQVANAWNGGPPGQITAPLTAAINGFNLPNACGVIIPGTSGVLGGYLNVDTCTWTWASQLHDALAIILPAWFGWWCLWFIVAAISGVLNRKVPSPADGAVGGESK